MSETTTAWRRVTLVPYGAVLHLPAGWETLPPRPDNGPEIVRATGGSGRTVIVFKFPIGRGTTAAQVAASAQERLAAHGFEDFSLAEADFGGGAAVALDFANPGGSGGAPYRSREYFTVRGTAAFGLGTGSTHWESYRPLADEIARRFELIDE